MKFFVCTGAEQVTNSIIICVQEEGGKVIIVSRMTLEAFKVARFTNSGAVHTLVIRAWNALCKPWQEVRT